MRKALVLGVLGAIAACGGCAGDTPLPRSDADAQLFGPISMRLHPIFTQVKDWTGDNTADGVEALVELQDQFGDPTKASGRLVFELFEFRPYEPERRGERVVNPWMGYLETLDEQRDRWNRTSRTYGFQLAWPQVQPARTYVLTAEFQLSNGARFFDQIILEGKGPEREQQPAFPTTKPLAEPIAAPGDNQPARRTPEP